MNSPRSKGPFITSVFFLAYSTRQVHMQCNFYCSNKGCAKCHCGGDVNKGEESTVLVSCTNLGVLPTWDPAVAVPNAT